MKPETYTPGLRFPTVSGRNLLREKITLPADFSGELNLLFVPFWQWQQMEVDSWVPFVSELENSQPGFHFYELPTIRRMNPLSRWFINEGMRAGLPNPKTRERTITLYIDKATFRTALAIADEAHITLLLADRQGQIIWRGQGAYTPETAASLAKAVQALHAAPVS
jgi:hypothetical protein